MSPQERLLRELRQAKAELEAAEADYKRLRLEAFRANIPTAHIAHATGEQYDAVRMARNRARV